MKLKLACAESSEGFLQQWQYHSLPQNLQRNQVNSEMNLMDSGRIPSN